MSSMETQQDSMTLYERIGGADRIQALVDRFYDLMDIEPKYKILRDVHGSTLEEVGNRLFMFLSGWTGGPDLYIEKHGHPRLKSRHLHFQVGTIERDQWVACFIQALHELEIAPEIQKELLLPIYSLAEWMRNQADAVEGMPLPPMQGQMSQDQILARLVQLAKQYDLSGWQLSE